MTGARLRRRRQRLVLEKWPGQVTQEIADPRRRRLNENARRKGETLTRRRLALANWSILVTNTPPEKLSLREAFVVARVRWQIELIFKPWKSQSKVDEWRTTKDWRILYEVYA